MRALLKNIILMEKKHFKNTKNKGEFSLNYLKPFYGSAKRDLQGNRN